MADQDLWVCKNCDIVIGPMLADATDVVCIGCKRPANRRFLRELTATLGFRETLELEQRRPGFRKPLIKLKQGADLFRRLGTFSDLLRIFDRVDPRGPRYRERVITSDGKIVKNVEGSLTDQTLHGPRGTPKKLDATEFADLVSRVLMQRGLISSPLSSEAFDVTRLANGGWAYSFDEGGGVRLSDVRGAVDEVARYYGMKDYPVQRRQGQD